MMTTYDAMYVMHARMRLVLCMYVCVCGCYVACLCVCAYVCQRGMMMYARCTMSGAMMICIRCGCYVVRSLGGYVAMIICMCDGVR